MRIKNDDRIAVVTKQTEEARWEYEKKRIKKYENAMTVDEIKELVNETKYGNVESEVFIANGGRNDLIHLDVVNDPWVTYKIYLN